MLYAFGAKNYFSFKEGTDVSFRLGDHCPDSISNGKGYSNVLGIKGANGAGKTNVLKAISFAGYFATDSFNQKPDAEIYMEPYFYCDDPSEFYVEFEQDGIFYFYELKVNEKVVVEETLSRKKTKLVPVFKRLANKLDYVVGDASELKKVKLRANASLISTAFQYELSLPDIEAAYKFFSNIITNVSYTGFNDNPVNYKDLAKYYSNNTDCFKFMKSIISECDIGITDIELQKVNVGTDEEEQFPVFIHGESEEYNRIVVFLTESSGTQSLYSHLWKVYSALSTGGLLVTDEFDINLHPDILPKLLNLFADRESNKNNAQIIFSTHDVEILDYLGKYRTYLVNKENNESYAYRLDELPGEILRNDRSISNYYRKGLIGGIPNLA